ncbi:MAG: 2-C-methyl-D-erythritol 4-phosphate cytidylyltransferase [Nocardioides sp.]
MRRHPRATDAPAAAGVALLTLDGRGALPFALLRRRTLLAHALESLTRAGHDVVVTCDPADADRVRAEVARGGTPARVDPDGWWDRARRGGPVLVHDPLCPLVDADFLGAVREQAVAHPDALLAAYRPVTDTVKTVVDGRIQGTIDRELLVALTAPVVIGAEVVAGAPEAPPVADFAALVAWGRDRARVELVKAPSLGRRVDDESSVTFLECVEELSRRTRH